MDATHIDPPTPSRPAIPPTGMPASAGASIDLEPALVQKYSAAVPRYTSYPTAPHFSPSFNYVQYVAWLASLPEAARLSLYLHIPYCQSLCWYCGCNTKATRRYEPIAAYVRTLLAEIANVSSLVGRRNTVDHIHWGGGSPNILQADDILRLGDALRAYYNVAEGAEIAVEIDPRGLNRAQGEAFGRIGVNRVSLGVQDFDPAVQAAIHRVQSFEATARAVEMMRGQGVTSVNIDLVYGLPHQTVATAERTMAQVIELQPDRVAVFGYAHLPSRLPHQRLIDAAALPDSLERFRQARRLAEVLEQHGYVRIGLDHFAKASDPLAQGQVARNFQGYTTDRCDALIGLGASAIGRLPHGYVQNATATGEYIRRIREDGVATARGLHLSDEDKLRGHVIERLMCDFEFDGGQLQDMFGVSARPVLSEAGKIAGELGDDLIEPTETGFRITPRGQPFVRSICARFDAYLGSGSARHSTGV